MAEKVALLDSIHPAATAVFEEGGLEVVHYSKSIAPADLVDLAHEVRLLGVRSGPAVPAEAMGGELEAISVFGVGTNHISRKTEEATGADDEGIAIFNAAYENTRSVAELVIGNTLALMRGTAQHNQDMHAGSWTKEDGREVRGKTMGIIGYGSIGVQVSVLAEHLGMDVVAYDPQPSNPTHGRAKMLENKEAVLAAADVVTLHIPGGEANRHYIDAEAIALMKPGSILINAARGELVDYEAVVLALESGQLGGVAVDVFEDKAAGISEPSKKGDDFEHVLKGVRNALLTPHIGGSTAEAQGDIGHKVAGRSLAYLRTGNSAGSVNLPGLALNGIEAGRSRLLNIHDNHPGVMADLTVALGSAGLNVAVTTQKTAGEIGYAVFDIEGQIPEEVIAAVGAMQATRRVRLISQ